MFDNLRISTKMFLVIGLLGAICVAVAGASVTTLRTLSAATEEVGLAGQEMRLSGRLNRLAVSLNRAEYRVAAEPAAVGEVAGQVADYKRDIAAALAEAKQSADGEQTRLLDVVERALAVYVGGVERTLELARSVASDAAVSEQQRAVLDAVQQSRQQVDAFYRAVVAYADLTESKSDAVAAQAAALAETRTTALIVGAAVGVLLGLLAGWMTSQYGVVRPIRAVVACLRGLADGKLETRVFGVGRRDEVGEIADAANVFKENLIRTQELERQSKEAEARAQAERRRATLELADRFEASVGAVATQVGGAASQLQASAGQLAAAVDQVASRSGAAAAASEQANANVQTVAAASEEMAAAIAELSRRVVSAADRSQGAAAGAEAARRELDDLAEAIEQVDQVVASINSVASQTNLLALNATIEAARAGDAGKGFAVVAQEVKNLANQTHSMTEQISSQIDSVKSASMRTVEAMRGIIAQVSEIDRATADMAASVEQQTAATGEISRNAQHAATGVQEVADSVGVIRQAGDETGAASGEVKLAADQLVGQAATLRREVEAFLSEVRAA